MMRALETLVLVSMTLLLAWCGGQIFSDLRNQARSIEILREIGK